MHYKPDWNQVQKRFEALWHQEMIDRCCIAITAPRTGFEHKWDYGEHKGSYNLGGMLTSQHMDDPATVLAAKEEIFDYTYFGGEAIPQIWLNYGPAGHAGYFDAPYGVSDVTTWFDPIIENYDTTPLAFNPNNQILKWQEAMVTYLAAKGKDRFLISTPDNSGNLDALASLRGTQELLMDLYDQPDQVKTALNQIYGAWKTAGDKLYNLAKTTNNNGSTIGWLSIWAPGQMSQLQSDISVMLSNPQFQEFELPELIRCSQSQPYSLYHMDGIEQLRHLDDILSVPTIQMIQWVSVAGQPNYMHHMETFKKIQESGKSLLINDVEAKDVKTLVTTLDPSRLLLMTGTNTQEEGEDLLKAVAEWSKR